MASIISAGTTSGTSLNLSGDTSGVLQLATNGSTTAITVDTSQNVGIGTASPSARLHTVTSSGGNKLIVEATAASQQAVLQLNTNASTPGQCQVYMGKSSAPTNGQVGYDPNSDFMYFYTSNSERMRIDSSGRVGIGGTPQASFTGWNNLFLGANNQLSSDANSIQIQANTYLNSSATNWIYSSTAASSRLSVGSQFIFNSAASGTAGTNITWTQTLAVGKDLTVQLQGATQSSGTGIAFPATQSASSDANTLDDYEEGTWTPTISAATPPIGATLSISGATYTKIGNFVFACCDVTVTSVGSGGSGILSIRGLPFASKIWGGYNPTSCETESLTSNIGTVIQPLINQNTTFADFYYGWNSTGGPSSFAYSLIKVGTIIRFTCYYPSA